MRGGQPSTTQPIAGPWLSPKVVTRKECPNVLNDMVEKLGAPATRKGAECSTSGASGLVTRRLNRVKRRRVKAPLRQHRCRCSSRIHLAERRLMKS
jgi:hypothetical protein